MWPRWAKMIDCGKGYFGASLSRKYQNPLLILVVNYTNNHVCLYHGIEIMYGDLNKLRDFVEIKIVTYRKNELKVFTQPVEIIRTLDPFKPKKRNGKTQKREWSSDQKKESKFGGKSRLREC